MHEKARTVRDEVFGRRVFVRGVVEVSSFCRQNCHYCAIRRDNRALTRYRLGADELAGLIMHRRPAAIAVLAGRPGRKHLDSASAFVHLNISKKVFSGN